MCVLFIAVTILLLIIIAILLPITIRFGLDYNKNSHLFYWQIGIAHDLLSKRFQALPKRKIFKTTKHIDLLSLMRQTLCRMSFWQIDAFVLLGVGDAAQTALCCGLLDAAFNALGSAFLPRGKNGRGFFISTTPAFDIMTLQARIRGIFRFRLAQIILAALAWRKVLKK